jgi:hypothetical protein
MPRDGGDRTPRRLFAPLPQDVTACSPTPKEAGRDADFTNVQVFDTFLQKKAVD